MKIETAEHKGHKLVSVSGDIDMYSAHELREELMRLTSRKPQIVLVNLIEVPYMDSSGIATFVEILKVMKRYGGRLKLVHMNEGIMEIFRFSKLDSIFEIVGEMDDALKS
ncbi:MAG: anti-sigma factor antagonist [Nitrospiraceae bacterium]|nr:MAG: anti-sigma factor antagonist [Nitrospiraceae bacterium]